MLAQEWDIVIIGGGITGAGILLEAARRGLKAVAGGAARLCLGHVQPIFQTGARRAALPERKANSA
jgi:glycine/D-amino acid oxidase-like deaminating enzyme